MNYTVDSIMKDLENLGKEQTKRTYMKHGAKEPLFGVTTGNLKPIAKKSKRITNFLCNCMKLEIMMQCISLE